VSVKSPSDVSTQISLSSGADMDLLLSVFGLPPDVVAATLGDVGIEEVVDLASNVSPTRSILASFLHILTSYFSLRSRTTWPSVSTGASKSATSRGANRPRTSYSPGSKETPSPNKKDEVLRRRERCFLPVPEDTLVGDLRVWHTRTIHTDNFRLLTSYVLVYILFKTTPFTAFIARIIFEFRTHGIGRTFVI